MNEPYAPAAASSYAPGEAPEGLVAAPDAGGLAADEGPRRNPGIQLLPTVVTLGALACGLSAARYASDGHALLSLLLVGAAAVLDGIDGRIARLLSATSKMGAELDSLCDAIGFGVTPALITYFLIVRPGDGLTRDLGWIAAVVYAACIILRLARFNTLLQTPDQPAFTKEFFVGVPAPAAALLALAPVFALVRFGPGWWSSPLLSGLWLLVVAFLAFSRIPTFSAKTAKVSPRRVPLLLLVFLLLIAGLMSQPLITVLIADVLYLLHIPYAAYSYRWLAAHPDAWEVPGPERRRLRRTGA